jgi:dTMP kinase
MFITVEGPTRIGKTAVLSQLASALRRDGQSAVQLAETSCTEFGAFTGHAEEALSGLALGALESADHYFQVEQEVKPAVARGLTVLGERYVATTMVRQRLDGVTTSASWELNCQALRPDLSVLLTGCPQASETHNAARARSNGERTSDLEAEYFQDAFEFLKGVGYQTLDVVVPEADPIRAAREIFEAIRPLRYESIGMARTLLQYRLERR